MRASFLSNFSHRWRRFYDSRRGYALFWLHIYLLTMALGASIFLYHMPAPENSLLLRTVQYQVSSAQSPAELSSQPWQNIQLPDDWQARSLKTGNVWYRGHIELTASNDTLWAVLIPALKMNAAVYLNGSLLGSGGRFEEPVARNWMTPLLFSIPAGMLQPGSNEILVRVKSSPLGTGKLDQLYFGAYASLLPSYRIHYLFRISSIEWLTTLLLIMGVLIASLWLVRRKDTYYGYYALATTVWGLHNFNIFLVDIPVSTRLWDWWAYTSIGYYTMLATLFIHRFLGRRHPRIEKFVIGGGMAFTIMLLFPDDETFYWLALKIWHPLVFMLGLYILIYSGIEAWKRQSMELQFITATGAITLLYAQHDIMLILGIADWRDGYYTQYASAVLLSVFSIILMRRFARSLNEVDQLNQNLEKRVANKHRQLEQNFQRLQQMENERVLAQERERLTRDIHDGMGGHLVSTLALIESGRADMDDIAEALKDSLTDLRLMIDSMDIEEDDLNTLLGMFRMRIEPRLKNSRLSLEWQVSDLPPVKQFGPREALHILRILQEAITNIIKHAAADRICLRTYARNNEQGEQDILIELSDNGCGIGDAQDSGNGLQNMRRRAHEAGGELTIDSSHQGTCVSIRLQAA